MLSRPASARSLRPQSARPSSASTPQPPSAGPRSRSASRSRNVELRKSVPSAALGAYITPSKRQYAYVPTKEDLAAREDARLEEDSTPRRRSLFVRYESKHKKWGDSAAPNTSQGGLTTSAQQQGGYSRAAAEITLQQILKARARATTAKALYKATWKI